MKHLCKEVVVDGQCTISLYQTDFDEFTVEYGTHVRNGLPYRRAAENFGECIVHALSCAGLVDNREKDEAKQAGDKEPFFDVKTPTAPVPEDKRTLAQLAQEALDIQNACNVSGLVFGWARSMKRFNELVKLDTDHRNKHPIHVMWSDKLASLTGAQYGQNYVAMLSECEKLAKGE